MHTINYRIILIEFSYEINYKKKNELFKFVLKLNKTILKKKLLFLNLTQ